MKQQKRLTTWGKTHSPVAYKWAQLTARKNVPNSLCVRPIVSETAKNVNGPSQSWWKHMKSQKREWKNAPAAPKTWGRQPRPWHYKNDLQSMGKMKQTAKTWKESHRKNSSCSQNVRKTEKRGCIAEWHTFLGIFLAKEVRTRFSKMGLCPIRIFAHTLPIPCNNWLNHILAEINDWGKRQER